MDSFVQENFANYYNFNGKEWDANFIIDYNKPTVMTYALFGAQIKRGRISIDEYDYIVCDELHTLNQYIAMSRGQLSNRYPQALPWEINDMLQMTCFTYMAVEAIDAAVRTGKIWVFALTATPQ